MEKLKEKQNNKTDKEKRNFFTDLKNIKRNYRIVKSHPIAGLRFKYKVQRNTLIVFGLFLIYNFYSIIKNYSATGYMSWVGRGLTLLILFIIITKAWSAMKIVKKNLDREEEFFKNNPKAYLTVPKTDVRSDIDELLKKFGENGKKNKK